MLTWQSWDEVRGEGQFTLTDISGSKVSPALSQKSDITYRCSAEVIPTPIYMSINGDVVSVQVLYKVVPWQFSVE
jgi:hypothetical protein